jgi:phosphotransferase system enzyme I (PtsP)
VQDEMLALKERLAGTLPSEERVLFDAYVMMLGSENLVEPTMRRIREGNWAPGALRETIRELAGIFEDMDDSYMRERGTDIRDLGCRILMHLEQSERSIGPQFSERTVLIGENVTVAELADVPPEQLAGVVSGRGSESSHVAILARALGVPAVMAATDLPFGRLHGREVVVDGYRGRVYIQPEAAIRKEFERLEREEQELSAGLGDLVAKPAITPDGERIPVYVNSGLLAEIHLAYQSGSDGIGLYRTEFPFMIRERFPSEDEQYEIYRHVLEAVAPRPVVLRTLDVGGDKPLPYFPVKEDNPFLGWRGIRITLDHPEIFLTQLRAMLRASIDLNNMSILFPMISTPGEVDEALGLLRRAWCKLRDEGLEVGMPQVGVMVEVPSAVYMVEALARRVDFLSVGTNDLIQYLLAVDRNNAQVSDLYSSVHPAVLKALSDVVAGARAAGKPVGLCGEMASDPAAVILLLGLGIDSLSVSVAGLPRVKWVINSFTRARAREILGQVMTLEDATGIRERLDAALVEVGLGGLVRPGRS